MTDQLVDAGFADPEAARMVMRRLRLRAALQDAQASAAALLDLFDEGLQADRDMLATLHLQGVRLLNGDLEGLMGGHPVNSIEGRKEREQQLLEGIGLVLQLFDALGVGLRHGLFSVESRPEASQPGETSHSLSGDAK